VRVESKFITIESDINGVVIADYIDNAQIWTGNAIKQTATLADVDTTILAPLPLSGWVEKKLYSYEGKAVLCTQPHNRTIYKPEDTPALFSFFRENSDQLQFIPNEKVDLGWKRWYNGKQYECLQPHQTQDTWNPVATLGVLWKEVIIVDPEVKPPQWVTGDWTKYTVGYKVFDSGKVWEAINTSHTWIQPALTGNGAISWKFVKDWV
jgi:hypothetical protein